MQTLSYSANPLQQCRAARAQNEAANYTCRASEIAGFLVVFVINEKSETVYTVNHLRRCNCADFQKRCDGRGIVCKHVLLADAHLDMVDAPAVTTPAVDPFAAIDAEEAHWDRVRRERDALWP